MKATNGENRNLASEGSITTSASPMPFRITQGNHCGQCTEEFSNADSWIPFPCPFENPMRKILYCPPAGTQGGLTKWRGELGLWRRWERLHKLSMWEKHPIPSLKWRKKFQWELNLPNRRKGCFMWALQPVLQIEFETEKLLWGVHTFYISSNKYQSWVDNFLLAGKVQVTLGLYCKQQVKCPSISEAGRENFCSCVFDSKPNSAFRELNRVFPWVKLVSLQGLCTGSLTNCNLSQGPYWVLSALNNAFGLGWIALRNTTFLAYLAYPLSYSSMWLWLFLSQEHLL